MIGDVQMTPKTAGEMARLTVKHRGLPIWTVTTKTTDYPGEFVARLTVYDKPSPYVLIADTLEALREMLPPGLHRLPRDPNDLPVIVEVWL